AEDGIRDWSVTGVQTCALPILYRTGRKLLLGGQINLVGANLLLAQLSRGFAEVAGQAGGLLGGGELGVQREIAQLHVFSHALPKDTHEKLLCQMDRLQAAIPCWRKSEPLRKAGVGERSTEPRQPLKTSPHATPAKRVSPMNLMPMSA